MWQRCWSLARILGLSDEDFYRKTPRQFHILVDQHREKVEHERMHHRMLAGIVAATIANWSARPPSDPLQPGDFVRLSEDGAETTAVRKVVRNRRVNRKQIDTQLRGFFDGAMAAQQESGKVIKGKSLE